MIRKLCYTRLTAALLSSLALSVLSAPAIAQPPLASAANPAPRDRPLVDLLCSSRLLTALLPACRPGVLSFQAQAYSADEGANQIAVTVTRTGGSGGAITVKYGTANGSAVANGDYVGTSGTLRWAARDATPRTFMVPISEDAMFEPNETFTVALSNPTGRATIGQGVATGKVLDNDPATIKLIGLNDFHGQLNPPGGTTRAPDPANPATSVLLPTGGVEFLATQVVALKALNPFSTVVGAGDLIGGSPLVSALFHDEPSILALDLLGLEFSSVGNHEFDDNAAELRRVQNGGCFPGGVIGTDTCIDGTFPGARFRYLAANVLDLSTGNSFFPGTAIKSFDIGGGESIKVGFIGLVLRNTPNIVTPAGVAGLSFQDEASTANSLVPGLRAAGAQAIVVLIHEGGTTTGLLNDQSCPGLAGDVLRIVDALDSAIDVVVSGHTHQAYICRRNGRLLTSAGAQGRVVTDIDLTLARNGFDVISSTARNLPIVNDQTPANPLPAAYPTLARNPAQTTLVTRYNTLVAPLANRVIGNITADITRVATTAGESALGDVIADAQLDATSPVPLGGALVAFMNPGGIRTDILFSQISGGEAIGQVTYGESFTVQPFGNSLTTMTLTGAQIDTLLEQQFDNPTAGQMRILQVSRGFAYTWDAAMPVGNRVAASSIRIGGVPVDPAANYRVTVNSFLATGGDRFFVLNSGTNRLGGAIDIDAQTDFFTANSPVPPGLRNRITRLN
ncbi:MAG: 5'-nucleotidase C-terminal domain-containing protein [Panacagrimonas sp.]